jgi:hypothetical protein
MPSGNNELSVNETMRFRPGEINGGDGRQCVYPKYDKAEFEAMRGLLSSRQTHFRSQLIQLDRAE